MRELAPIILPLACIAGTLIGGMFYLAEKVFKLFKESLEKIEKEFDGMDTNNNLNISKR